MKPQRIISLVPSLTELLFTLGLDNEVVGITKFCVHPDEWFKTKTRIGGTKNINLHKVHALQPDLIIANKEENTKEQIELLQQHFPVFITDVHGVSDALSTIQSLGALVHKKKEAEKLCREINSLRNQYRPISIFKNALYLIWNKPYMCAGIDTFIHAMMNVAGFKNCIQQERYPVLTQEQIAGLNPELVLLSSEPYPFKQKHVETLQRILPDAKIILANGELFSWYGSRMLHAFPYFRVLNEQLS